MSKRRSPYKRKTKPRPATNPVAKHMATVCRPLTMTDKKKALKKGYQKHKTQEYFAEVA